MIGFSKTSSRKKIKMFLCQITGKLTRPGQKVHRLVVQKRDKVYTQKIRNEETNKWEDVEVGRGWEIAKEVNASEEGRNIWESWTDEDRAAYAQNLDH